MANWEKHDVRASSSRTFGSSHVCDCRNDVWPLVIAVRQVQERRGGKDGLMSTFREEQTRSARDSWSRGRWFIVTGLAIAIIVAVVLVLVYSGGGGSGGGGGY